MMRQEITPLTPLSEDAHLKRWGDHQQPVISILCATYHHVEYIEQAICGFLGQETAVPFEIIIRDDASTDGTTAILQQWQARYPTILRVIYEPHNTFSKGLKPAAITYPAAKGRYIALCDGDDYWTDSKKLQRQFEWLEKNPEYVLCCHAQIMSHYRDGLILPKAKSESNDITADQLQKVSLIGNSTLFFRNHVQQMPLEFYRVTNGDLFLTSYLGGFGKGRFMHDIQPSVYHFHGKGVWSSKGEVAQSIQLAITHLQLGYYHQRTGNETIAQYLIKIAHKKLQKVDKIQHLGNNVFHQFVNKLVGKWK